MSLETENARLRETLENIQNNGSRGKGDLAIENALLKIENRRLRARLKKKKGSNDWRMP